MTKLNLGIGKSIKIWVKPLSEVWVLGSKHQRAHASFEWEESCPNFSNADTLIINLQSLNKDRISKTPLMRRLYEETRRQVFDMLMTGEKTVVVVLSSEPTSLDWLPMYPIYKPTAPAKLGKIPDVSAIKDYLKNVEECSFYFKDMDVGYFEIMTNPKSEFSEKCPFTLAAREAHGVRWILEKEMQNVAKQNVGGVYKAKILFGKTYDGRNFVFREHYDSGEVWFLPPSTKKSAEQAIDSLLDSFIGVVPREPIGPDWEISVDLPKLATLRGDLHSLEKEIESLNSQADKVRSDITDMTRLRRLLWADGEALEMAVKEAFEILGFQEIRKIRADNLEDWVFDFKHIKEFKHAILEVKASEKRTSMADLTQTNKWVDDYWLEDKKVKGVFIPNQYRLNDIKKSSKEREQFAPNELDYAATREICILPTNQLFAAVEAKLKTGKTPTREVVEEKIAESNDLCVFT